MEECNGTIVRLEMETKGEIDWRKRREGKERGRGKEEWGEKGWRKRRGGRKKEGDKGERGKERGDKRKIEGWERACKT